MKFTILIVSLMCYNLVTGFHLEINKIIKNNKENLPMRKNLADITNNSGNSNNNNEIGLENNWKTNETDRISRTERSKNLKQDHPSRMRWDRRQTIPDQFYDYSERSGHLKEIEVEKIATENKKLDNIFVDDSVADRGNEFRVGVRDDGSLIPSSNQRQARTSSIISNPFSLLRQNYEEMQAITTAYPTNEDKFLRLRRQIMQKGNNELATEKNTLNFPYKRGYLTDERKHISDIKDEVAKLQNLVQILRDQQYILNLLNEVDNDTNLLNPNLNNTKINIPEFSDVLKDIDQHEIENPKKTKNQDDQKNIFLRLIQNITLLEKEFNELDYFVKNVVLKKINNEISLREDMRIFFENEFTNLKNNLSETRHLAFTILKILLKNDKNEPLSYEKPKAINNKTDLYTVLEQLKNLENNLSTILNGKSRLPAHKGDNDFETSVEDPPLVQARLNSIDDKNKDIDELLNVLREKDTSKKNNKSKLQKLLKELDTFDNEDSLENLLIDPSELNLEKDDSSLDSDTEISEFLLQLGKFLNKKSEVKTKRGRILNHLQKLSKSNDSNEKLNLKLLIKILQKIHNGAESKIVEDNKDEDLIANLKQLSDEINNLSFKDDIDSEQNENNIEKDFKDLFQKVIGGNKPQQIKPKFKLTKSQIVSLMKKLAAMANENNNKDNSVPVEENINFQNLPPFGSYNCEKLPNYNKQYSLENWKNIYKDPQYHQNFQKWYRPNIYTPQSDSYNQNPLYEQPVNYNQNYGYSRESKVPYAKLFQDFRHDIPTNDYNENLQNFGKFDQYPNAPYAVQYPFDSPKNTVFDAQEKIEDLKEQIDNLKGVISALNQPQYIQKPDDKKVIENLNRQIDNLKDVVYNLAGEPSYNVNTNYPKSESYSKVIQNQEKYNQNQQNYKNLLNSEEYSDGFKAPVYTDLNQNQPTTNNENYAFQKHLQPLPKNGLTSYDQNVISDQQSNFQTPYLNQYRSSEGLKSESDRRNTNYLQDQHAAQYTPIDRNKFKNDNKEDKLEKNKKLVAIAANKNKGRSKRSADQNDSQVLTSLLLRILEDFLDNNEVVSNDQNLVEDVGRIMKMEAIH